jgi:hypothetical protein
MSDPLATSIPRLDTTGSNWAIFSMRFQEAMEANWKWSHFTGSPGRPVPADPNNITTDETKAIDEWDQDEVVARYLLSQRLPDSTAVRLKGLTTAKERWDKVIAEFSVKSQYVLRHGRDVHPAWVNVVTAALATKVVRGSGDES